MMVITPRNIFDWRDRELLTPRGRLQFRLYSDGWLVRYISDERVDDSDQAKVYEKVEGADVFSACAFANDRL